MPIDGILELQLSTVIWSSSCAFFLENKGSPDFTLAEAKHLRVMKTEVHLYQVRT